MNYLRQIRVTLGGAEVAKWYVNRIGLNPTLEKMLTIGSSVSGFSLTSAYHPIYLDMTDEDLSVAAVEDEPIPYLGEDAYVEFVVAPRSVQSAGTNTAIIGLVLQRLNEATNGLVDGASKVSVELERDEP